MQNAERRRGGFGLCFFYIYHSDFRIPAHGIPRGNPRVSASATSLLRRLILCIPKTRRSLLPRAFCYADVRSVMPTCVLLCRRAFCYANARFVMQTCDSLCKRPFRYANVRFVMPPRVSLCHRAFRYATVCFVMPPCVSLCHCAFRYAFPGVEAQPMAARRFYRTCVACCAAAGIAFNRGCG
jgi:hypothetical protein